MGKFPEYDQYDALALSELVRKGEVSPIELLQAAKERLERVNGQCNAVRFTSDDFANGLINNLDKESLFCGVPFLVKDLLLPFKGMPMSSGTRAMKSYVSDENCVMADRLNAAGLITFGITTTSELGTSSLTNTAAFGATKNPWDLSKNSGGSSGGSSVAVATRVVPMAYASDGGGSIRIPASYCGIFGLKPSRKLNRFEDMSDVWGGAVVSHVSTISVRDSAAYLDMVSGNRDKHHSVQNPDKESYLYSATQSEAKLRIGMITEPPTKTEVHPECIKATEAAASLCEKLGHTVEPTQWNFDGRELMRAFTTVLFHYTHLDVTSMAQLLGVPHKKVDLELNTRFMSVAGSGISRKKVEQALIVWQNASRKMSELHQRFDLILTPTVATPPLENSALDLNALEKALMGMMVTTGLGKLLVNEKVLDMLIDKFLYSTPFTPVANTTGQPAMSVPLYWNEQGLPVGVQFMAAEGNDRTLLMLARQLEYECPWRDRVPGIVGA